MLGRPRVAQTQVGQPVRDVDLRTHLLADLV